MLPFLLVISALGLVASQGVSKILPSWGPSGELHPLKTVAGFQTVVNPSTSREGPYHDQVYDKIATLGAQYQRYVPWLPYPRMGIAELEPPSHGGLCGFVNSGGPNNLWSTTLDCGKYGAGTIDSVVFADYGLPTGFCNSLKSNPTCTKDVKPIVSAACLGKASCTLLSSDATFGAAPCGGNRLAVEVTCSNKAVEAFTYWDFELLDQGMLDFLTAANSSSRTSIINFSTLPNFFFVNPDRSYFPDDPLGETFSYEKGTVLVDPTGEAVGDYYGRLLAHYIEGGFTDEAGRWIPGYNYTFSHWEVLNEVNFEHDMSPAFYTILYDAIVRGIKKWAPRGSANLQYFGLGGAGEAYVTYFLNRTNHKYPDTPIDWISIHSYAGATRNGSTNGSAYEAFFPHQRNFISTIPHVYDIIAASDYPNVKIDCDEVGVILPDDNDPKFTADDPGFPAIYWNAAAGMYGMMYGLASVVGLDVLGESQLIGYPSIPFHRGPPYNGNWTAPPQYPSVSMLSWGGAFGNPGDGTARYWVLKLLVDSFKPGPPAGNFPAAEADMVVSTMVQGGGATPTSPFCAQEPNLSVLTMYCQTGVINAITFASYGTPTGTCGSWAVNASCNAPNSTAIVTQACVGKAFCSIPTTTPEFGDPCYDVVKELVVEATCSTGGGAQGGGTDVYAQAYQESAASGGLRKVLVVNTQSEARTVQLAGATGGTWAYVDESTAFGPPAVQTLTEDTWTLAPYSAGVVKLAARTPSQK